MHISHVSVLFLWCNKIKQNVYNEFSQEHMYRTGVFDYANDYFVIKNMIWKNFFLLKFKKKNPCLFINSMKLNSLKKKKKKKFSEVTGTEWIRGVKCAKRSNIRAVLENNYVNYSSQLTSYLAKILTEIKIWLTAQPQHRDTIFNDSSEWGDKQTKTRLHY